jgi:hypothetical protein
MEVMVYASLIQRIICSEDDYTFYTKQHTYLAGSFMSHNQNKCCFGQIANRKQSHNLIFCTLVYLRQSVATIFILHPISQFLKKLGPIIISTKLK